MEPNTLANKACEAAGGQAELARKIGVSPSAIQQWRTGHRPIPLQHCSAIENATKGVVSRKALRPDDWQTIWPELADTAINGTPTDGSIVRQPIGRTRQGDYTDRKK